MKRLKIERIVLYRNTLAISTTHVHRINKLINFEKFISTNGNIPKYSLFSFMMSFDLEQIIFEIFNIFENNIISVELAKVLGYIEEKKRLTQTI